MKIAIFTDSFRPNNDGVASVTEMIAQELTKRGHSITIICPGETTEIIKQDRYKIIRVISHSINLYRIMRVCFKTPDYLIYFTKVFWV